MSAASLPRRSRWREFALMHMLLSKACNPPLSLRGCMQAWRDIAAKLREPTRKRRYQCEAQKA
jgi:hypothetical protein